MCIGIPVRVVEAWPGVALVCGRGGSERLDTRLIGGSVTPGDWLLAFQGAARERLDASRAAEINATLDLVEAAMGGDAERAAHDAAFELPSRMTPQQLAALAGSTPPALQGES